MSYVLYHHSDHLVGFERSSIGGNSPLIIESDNFNVDTNDDLSITFYQKLKRSIGIVSAIDVPTGLSVQEDLEVVAISFDTEDTRIEVTGSIVEEIQKIGT